MSELFSPDFVYQYMIGDYLDVGTPDTPDIQLMQTFENIEESPNAQTVEKHFTCNKSATTITTGYKTQFAITTAMCQNEKVSLYLRDIAEEQKLGITTDFYRVRIHEPVKDKANTYYARKFRVGFAISKVGGKGGEIKTIDGNMNAIGDVAIGEFNIKTKTFTAKEDAGSGGSDTPAVSSYSLKGDIE